MGFLWLFVPRSRPPAPSPHVGSVDAFLSLLAGSRSDLELAGGEPARFRCRSLQFAVPVTRPLCQHQGRDAPAPRPACGTGAGARHRAAGSSHSRTGCRRVPGPVSPPVAVEPLPGGCRHPGPAPSPEPPAQQNCPLVPLGDTRGPRCRDSADFKAIGAQGAPAGRAATPQRGDGSSVIYAEFSFGE